MSEREYYTNLPYTNFCKMRGYEERIEKEDLKLGIASFRIHQSLVQKPESFNNYWPFQKDAGKPKDTYFMTKEMLAKIKKAHNLK